MGRSPCCDKNGLKKGPWTPEEDHKLVDYIQKNGYGKWRTLPKNAGIERCGKSCRLRWTNYLRPDIKRGRFSFEEEETIIQLHSVLGNKWSTIAARLPGRTDNEIKNYWNTHIRKRLSRMGIDPVTHSPRLDLLDLSSILTPNNSQYNSSQINLSRLLGVQNLVNPQLLRLATSLFSSQRENQNFLQQNFQENNVYNQVVPNDQLILPSQVQEFANSVPFSTDHHQAQVMQMPQFTELDNWQSNDNFVHNFNHCDSDQIYNMGQTTMQSENSDYRTNNSNNLVSLTNLSTPVSSPTQINSTSTTTAEDEREYYGISSMFNKFEFPDILDDNCFM